MSWLKLIGTARLQSVAEEQKLSAHFGFRKYLLFSPKYITFCEKHAYCQIYPEHPVCVHIFKSISSEMAE